MRRLFKLWLSVVATLLILHASTVSSLAFNGSAIGASEAGVLTSDLVAADANRIGLVALISVESSADKVPKPTCVADSTITYTCHGPKLNGYCFPVRHATAAIGIYTIDGQTCAGAILGKTKNAVYFLTAAECLEREPTFSKSKLTLTSGSQSVEYQFDTLYRMDRRLGYAILTISPRDGTNFHDKYGFLQLRKRGPKLGERIYVPRYLPDDGWLLGSGTTEDLLRVELYDKLEKCSALTPASRFNYKLPLMEDYYLGAPVISANDGTIIGVHVCGHCGLSSNNSAVESGYIVANLIVNGSMLNFLAPPYGSNDYA